MINDRYMYFGDCKATHTLLKYQKYFFHLILGEAHIQTIFVSTKLIEVFGKDNIISPEGTRFIVNNALFSIKYQKDLLSFKSIRIMDITLTQ